MPVRLTGSSSGLLVFLWKAVLRHAVSLLALLVALLCAPTASSARTLPDGFEDVQVGPTSTEGPMSLAALPDGRILGAGRSGRLWLIEGDEFRSVLNLRPRLCWDAERGMVGVAVDPDFATNRYVYLYYTYNRHHTPGYGVCETNTRSTPVNRVARFRMGAGDVVDPASERILIDNIPSYSGNHNAGDLGFGNDGYLYVSVGDGGCDYAGDSGCFTRNDASRDRHALLGKVLRITRDGEIPAGNPYAGPAAGRCARRGRTSPGRWCAETFASGLRNPFRFAFDPAARATRFFINDTGDETREEIDLGQKGADYGWNLREGSCETGSKTNCGPAPRGLTDPILDYAHGRCGAITGGAFVPPAVWPQVPGGSYLFGDYKCGRIMIRRPGARRASVFASGIGPVVDMVFLPYGDAEALFYTTWKIQTDEWRLRRIAPRSAADSELARPCGGGIGVSIVLLGLCAVGARAASRRRR